MPGQIVNQVESKKCDESFLPTSSTCARLQLWPIKNAGKVSKRRTNELISRKKKKERRKEGTSKQKEKERMNE
jgi:hypothetical protein